MSGNLQDNYSPNWVPYFTPEGSLLPDVVLSVECGICDTKLAITNQVDDHHESFAMLPCGHVFGHRCITEWFSHKPSCPICRKSFEHPICHHYTVPQEIQGRADFNIYRDLPPTMAASEERTDSCGNCHRNPSADFNFTEDLWVEVGGRSIRLRASEGLRIEYELVRAEIRSPPEAQDEDGLLVPTLGRIILRSSREPFHEYAPARPHS